MEERQDIKALCKAAFEGDHDMCRTILQRLPTGHINHRNDRGQTALYCAARNGHEDVIKLLLGAKDIDVNAQEAHGSTALHAASFAPHPNVLSLLLSYGCDTNIKNKALAEKELTAHDEARGGAIEVWTLYKTGGVKALTRKGFPVMTRNVKSFKTASVKTVRPGSGYEKTIGGPTISMGSGKDKKNRNSGKTQPRLLSTPSPIVNISDPFTSELPSAPPADSEEITDLSDLVRGPRRSNKKTPFSPNEEDSGDDEIELSFTEYSGDEADLPSHPNQNQKRQEGRRSPELWYSQGNSPHEVQEQQIWVLFGEDCDAIPVDFNIQLTIADFKQFLCQNDQFPELAEIPLKNVNLFMKDDMNGEDVRLDVRRKVGSYGIGNNLVVVKVNNM